MNEILKMLFKSILFKREEIAEIRDTDDLYETAINVKQIIKLFAAMNDMGDEYYNTAKVLAIANEAYQEVCGNA